MKCLKCNRSADIYPEGVDAGYCETCALKREFRELVVTECSTCGERVGRQWPNNWTHITPVAEQHRVTLRVNQ